MVSRRTKSLLAAGALALIPSIVQGQSSHEVSGLDSLVEATKVELHERHQKVQYGDTSYAYHPDWNNHRVEIKDGCLLAKEYERSPVTTEVTMYFSCEDSLDGVVKNNGAVPPGWEPYFAHLLYNPSPATDSSQITESYRSNPDNQKWVTVIRPESGRVDIYYKGERINDYKKRRENPREWNPFLTIQGEEAHTMVAERVAKFKELLESVP